MADLQPRPGREDSASPVPSSPEPEWKPAASTGAELVGQTIADRWIVERKLGQGGMGVVYGARHSVIDRRVALKVLRAEMARDPQVLARFVQEAKAASRIGNPHIVEVSDFGQLPDGSTYFAMELLVGRSLAEAIDEHPGKPLPLARVVHVARQVAQGLGAAHDAGIIHRDLKPDNVMLVARGSDADFVKVLDFGIAKMGTSKERVTRAGQVFGTPHYMSPEQAEGKQVDARTDIYALGVMLFEMASGKVPFDADNFMGILTQHMYKEVPSLRAAADGAPVPDALESIVRKCMAKKVADRYLTMDEVGADLERFATGFKPLAPGSETRALAKVAASGRSFAQTGYSAETLPEIPATSERAGSQGDDVDDQAATSPLLKTGPMRPVALGIGSALIVVLSGLGLLASRHVDAGAPVQPDRPVVPANVPAVPAVPAVPTVSAPLPTVSAMAEPSPVVSATLAAVVDAGKPKAAPRRGSGGGARPRCNIEDPGCDPWK